MCVKAVLRIAYSIKKLLFSNLNLLGFQDLMIIELQLLYYLKHCKRKLDSELYSYLINWEERRKEKFRDF